MFRIAVSLCYYGLSINTNDLGGDRYIASFLSGAMEVPGYLLCYIGLEKLGGRKSYMIMTGLSGVSLLILPWLLTGKVCGIKCIDFIPLITSFYLSSTSFSCSRALARSSLELEIWGSNFGLGKSDTFLPTACHLCDISLKEAASLAGAMTRRWAPTTRDTLRRKTASIMKELWYRKIESFWIGYFGMIEHMDCFLKQK